MDNLSKFFLLEHLKEARDKVNSRFDSLRPNYDNRSLSNLLFRAPLSKTNEDAKLAHLQAIHTHLNRLLEDDNSVLIKDGVYLELSKSITQFDRRTGFLEIPSMTFGDDFLASQHFFNDAISSYKNHVSSLYQGDINFSCIPIKLRLAIEVYFKNMIGYTSSQQDILNRHQQSKTQDYPLSIADLLKFFSDKKFKKYARLPIDVQIARDINYWSNNLVHTGVISFAWQNLTAIDLLSPLFKIKHENDTLCTEGFNYLDLNYNHKDLAKDLSEFLSSRSRKVTVNLRDREEKPVEGIFYYRQQDDST